MASVDKLPTVNHFTRAVKSAVPKSALPSTDRFSVTRVSSKTGYFKNHGRNTTVSLEELLEKNASSMKGEIETPKADSKRDKVQIVRRDSQSPRRSPVGKNYSSVGMYNDAYNAYAILAQTATRSAISEHIRIMQTSQKQEACIELLQSGNVHSFVDLFYLTHANPEGPQTGTEATTKLEGSLDLLSTVKNNLRIAEDATRKTDSRTLITAYLNLASVFEILEDRRLAVHYHQKTLDIALALHDWTAAGKAHEALGIQFQHIGDIEQASSHFESFLAFAKRANDREDETSASSHLISVYQQHAAEYEAARDYDNAIVYLQKCIEKAKIAQDTKAEGEAHFKLGHLYRETNNDKKAIDHFTYYKELCKSTRDFVGEGNAAAALATVYQTQQDPTKSAQFLLENIEIADRTGQVLVKADAYCNLGMIRSNEGNLEEAVTAFEQYLTLAKQADDRAAIDRAKVYLGVTKGNLMKQKMEKMFS